MEVAYPMMISLSFVKIASVVKLREMSGTVKKIVDYNDINMEEAGNTGIASVNWLSLKFLHTRK